MKRAQHHTVHRRRRTTTPTGTPGGNFQGIYTLAHPDLSFAPALTLTPMGVDPSTGETTRLIMPDKVTTLPKEGVYACQGGNIIPAANVETTLDDRIKITWQSIDEGEYELRLAAALPGWTTQAGWPNAATILPIPAVT